MLFSNNLQIITKIKPIAGSLDRKDILSPAMEKLHLSGKTADILSSLLEQEDQGDLKAANPSNSGSIF